MSDRDWLDAADLAMPESAYLSHVSRIQCTGLDVGPARPVHFTIAGDHHLAVNGIFLHRTEVMPPRDDIGVTPGAAFIQCCASMRLVDLIVIGDHLLRTGLVTLEEIVGLSRLHPWRPGAHEARWVVPWLDHRSRSPKESELRAFVVASGLPSPEVNTELFGFDGTSLGIGDLVFRLWRLVAEYEGRQHAEDTVQFRTDIERYAGFRQHDVAYVQVTAAMIANPVGAVHRIYAALVRQGYAGPPPTFSANWGALFQGVRVSRAGGGPSTESDPGEVDDAPQASRCG